MEHLLTLGIHGKLEGYLRVDPFGRAYIDTCPSDEIHLTSSPPEGQERHTCRKYLEDLLPVTEKSLGKQVRISYEIHIQLSKEI